ncbi:MAG TPA: hypothetical protein VIJ14_02190 [Rhabdochlamydiaceae bacterium]
MRVEGIYEGCKVVAINDVTIIKEDLTVHKMVPAGAIGEVLDLCERGAGWHGAFVQFDHDPAKNTMLPDESMDQYIKLVE